MVYLGDPHEAKAETLSGSWLCHACRSMGMMGALYEDVENFFGGIFAWYGRIVARSPLFFVLFPLITCSLLGLGILTLEYETDLETLYAPLDGFALRNKKVLEEFYRDESGENFIFHQMVSSPLYVSVITSSVATNTSGIYEYSEAMQALYDVVTANISVHYEGRQLTYKDLCARRHGVCVVEAQDSPQFNASLLDAVAQSWNPSVIRKIRFALRSNDSWSRDLSIAWEKEFVREMSLYSSPALELRFIASKSLDFESQDQVVQDTKFLGFGILAIVVFAIFTGSGGNCVTNHTLLALAGVVAALMSMLAAFGLLGLMGAKIVSLCGVMPFLILGIGTDDMFQLMTEWRQGNVRDSVEERMAHTLRSAAVAITVTSLTDLIAFCIGATCPYYSVRNFCVCSGLGIFLCYVNQLTFFCGCLALHAKRVEASRHCLACCKVKSQSEMEDDRSHPLAIRLCAGHPPRRIGEEGGVCKRISKVIYTHYPRFILHWVSKLVVLFLFFLYIVISILGTVRVQKGLDSTMLTSPGSYYNGFAEWDNKHFPLDGSYVSFAIDHPMTYFRPGVRGHLSRTVRSAEMTSYVVNGSTRSWLEAFYKHLSATNSSYPEHESGFIASVMEFFAVHNDYANDIVISEDRRSILSSRIYFQCHKLSNNRHNGMLLQLRRIANSSPFLMLAYGPDFPLFEHNLTIMRNTLLPVGVTFLGMLFVALVFVPHPIAVTCITVSMISVVLGMVSFLSFWGLALSAITTIQIILSTGICVSFTIHMCHAFMTATGKNRNERVTVALEKVGVPILNGALASLFCALMVAFGSSIVFVSFFKTMILVSVLGLLHSVVFLPVMLSFIGPRRTSKPRVFIAVSPSSRSLQDTYRANAILRPPPSTPRLQPQPKKNMTVDSQTPLTYSEPVLDDEDDVDEFSSDNFELTLGGDDDSVTGQDVVQYKKNSNLKRKVSFGQVSIGSSESAPVDPTTSKPSDTTSIVSKPSNINIETIDEESEI